MIWQVLISGFLLGSVSSFHCIGMCGPLALSLPFAGLSPGKRIAGIMLYNLGRVITYAVLGLFFGFVGRQFFIAGYQQSFSIVLGSLIIAIFIAGLFRRKLVLLQPANKFYTFVQSLVAGFLRIRTAGGFFLTGLANGLLPCGMVYLAITGALATSNAWYGMEFMAAFGLGTLPAMMFLSLAGSMISVRTRSFVRQLTPYAMLIMGALLIMRGMNLGIPFLSPSFAAGSAAAPCH